MPQRLLLGLVDDLAAFPCHGLNLGLDFLLHDLAESVGIECI
jgi:hypothetical protein